MRRLRTAKMDLAELMLLWKAGAAASWSSAPDVHRLLGERVLRAGEPLLAYDIVREGLRDFPDDVRLRQLQGLALARSGASVRAGEILAQLRAEKHVDEETLGMLARTYKDCAARTQNSTKRRALWSQAAVAYDEAYRLSRGIWTGINAAMTALLTGKKARARALALEVQTACQKQLRADGADKFWLFATLGEAALVLRDWPQAEDWYGRAAQISGHRFGDLQSSKRNARLLLIYWNANPAAIEAHLRIPQVIVFAGHMIDQPDRSRARFSEDLESAVAAAIRERLKKLDGGFGFSSAACGADILFLEAMLAGGGEVTIVLPYELPQFIADSVEIARAPSWRRRFEQVLNRAARVVIASPQKLAIGGVSYDYANQMLLGLATIRARQLETALVPLAVWDGSSDGPGGTESAVRRWETLKLPLEVIDLPKMRPASGKSTARKSRRAEEARGPFGSQIMAMLFADAVGFSKLTEAEVPRFVRNFLGAISRLISTKSRGLVAKNTWGDGLYLVFATVESATAFALDLRDLVVKTDWTRHGLPAGLSLRIGLHAGPVYECHDPITRTRTFTGTHVSRAARIEPITPPGQVYASEAVAALASAQPSSDFCFEYAGQIPTAKNYGTFPMYHVRRA